MQQQHGQCSSVLSVLREVGRRLGKDDRWAERQTRKLAAAGTDSIEKLQQRLASSSFKNFEDAETQPPAVQLREAWSTQTLNILKSLLSTSASMPTKASGKKVQKESCPSIILYTECRSPLSLLDACINTTYAYTGCAHVQLRGENWRKALRFSLWVEIYIDQKRKKTFSNLCQYNKNTSIYTYMCIVL